MAAESKIKIQVENLGTPDYEFGINPEDLKLVDGNKANVNVLIDGVSAVPKAEEEAISVTTSPLPERKVTVAVTRKIDNKVIRMLMYNSKTGSLIPVKRV